MTRLLGLLFASLGLAGPVLAQGGGDPWPARSIRLIVPYPAGGPTDVLGRLIGQRIGETLGQSVVVDNRPGAGAVVGTEALAKAAADGYTIGLGNNATHATNQSLYPRLPYRTVEDFAPIALVATVTNLLVVHPKVGVKDAAGLVAHLKARPGELNYASTGNGSAAHLVAELFKVRTATDMLHVPYRGSTPAATDLLSGQVQVMFATLPTVLQHVQAGGLVALGVTGAARWPTLPDVPTLQEAGMAGFDADAWFGFLAPAGTPRPIVDRLNAEIGKAMGDPSIGDRLAQLGFRATMSTPEAFASHIAAEVAKWADVVKLSGAKLD